MQTSRPSKFDLAGLFFLRAVTATTQNYSVAFPI
ncbi:hypothetical protein ALFP_0491 [Alcaligenes faecalis]|nr:hypothetical protein ALFP_0491 [Alcaligenes faecalis]